MLYLHDHDFEKARELEETIQQDPEQKALQLYVLGDFQPSRVGYTGKYVRVMSDARVERLSAYLLTELEHAEEWVASNLDVLETCLTCFFMDGTGPSPFNARLGDVYLKVGHYNPVVHDREMVQHAIIHELTHIYLRNEVGFSVGQSEFGIRKFFDEGFAQCCGYRAVGAFERKLAHANACSSVVVKQDLEGLVQRIENWQETLFRERHYPLYQASLSFIASFEASTGHEGILQLFQAADNKSSFSDIIRSIAGESFEHLLSTWAERLPNPDELDGRDFFKVTSTERLSSGRLRIGYVSEFPLYPVNDVLALDPSGRQLEVSIDRSKRYEESGDFIVSSVEGRTLSLTIVHDDMVQQIETGE